MYDYNNQLTSYQSDKVNISEKSGIRGKLRGHREANQNRLKTNLPKEKPIQWFQKQGSYAHRTMIQMSDNDYDIDDGAVFKKEDLVNREGNAMSALDVRDMVLAALQDPKFKKAPERLKNCVRVYYNEGHHVDVPAFRVSEDFWGREKIEIASSDWRESNPKQINKWFDDKVSAFKENRDGKGDQFRRMIRLLKRFARSRPSWNMPSGLILTMLTAEKMPNYERDDECFYYLLQNLHYRLRTDLRVYNAADSSEELTKTSEDANMVTLRDRVAEALEKLAILHDDKCTQSDARSAWDWVFKSDGYFDDFDGSKKNGSTFSIASNTPTKPVDPQGGGRFG